MKINMQRCDLRWFCRENSHSQHLVKVKSRCCHYVVMQLKECRKLSQVTMARFICLGGNRAKITCWPPVGVECRESRSWFFLGFSFHNLLSFPRKKKYLQEPEEICIWVHLCVCVLQTEIKIKMPSPNHINTTVQLS